MPRRVQVRQACLQCRRKRRKCDGNVTCEPCLAAGSECVYYTAARESKQSLRSEIERLRSQQHENEILLDALSSGPGVGDCNDVLEALAAGESRRAIAQKLLRRDSTNHAHRRRKARGLSSRRRDGTTPSALDDEQHTPPETPGALSTTTMSSENTPSPTEVSSVDSDIDTWARLGWSREYTRKLLDTVLSWDFTLLCVLYRPLFFQDFEQGSNEYCSKSLVNALLALGTRLIKSTEGGESPNNLSFAASSSVFEEALHLVRDNSSSLKLADIQARGVLALYQVSCGRLLDARCLAEEFAMTMKDVYFHSSSAVDSELHEARALTYCGAITLNRIIRLALGHASGPPLSPVTTAAQDPERGQGSSSHGPWIDLDGDLDVACPEPDDPRFIVVAIAQLTEWVYKFRYCADKMLFDDAMQTYVQVLELYSSIFPSTKASANDAPLMLSAHMYFNFCVISLFSHFLDIDQEDDAWVKPQDIAKEAAKNILLLAQSYDSLFVLGNPPGLVSHFTAAAHSVLKSG